MNSKEPQAPQPPTPQAAERDMTSERLGGLAPEIYRSVIAAMVEGVVIHEASGAIRAANAAAERILGLTLEQMTGREAVDPRWALVDDTGRPLEAHEIPSEITQRTGRPCRNVGIGVQRAQGDRAWLRVNTEPIADRPGERPRLVVATFTDVTEEREAKRELERSRAYFQQLIDSAPGMVYEFFRGDDGRMRFPYMSAAVKPMLGLEADDVRENAAAAFARVHAEDGQALNASIVNSAKTLTPWEQEFRVRLPGGDWRWVRGRATPKRVDGGVLWTGMMLDVTQEHRLADRLRKAARREAMGDMAAGVAHNFNNMLAAILPNLELAMDQTAPPVRALLADAHQAARSAADLVRQLMSFARTDALDLQARAVDLSAIVRETVRFCQRTFDRRIVIEARVPDVPIEVWGLTGNFHQVVLNLCINARDALTTAQDARTGSKAPARLVIELARQAGQPAGSADCAVLMVRDNGIGMSDEVLARVGEPFFTTKGPGRGTGLGLASVFGIVRDAGGTVSVDSRLGEGTTFLVKLPCHAARARTVTPPPPRRPSRPGARGHVLLVDDEQLVRQALRRQLETIGYDVTEAPSGEDALGLLAARGGSFDVVLLDLSMPGLPGVAVLREARARHPGLPIVVVSGHVEGNAALEGAAAVLHKPIVGNDLVAALDEVLERRRGQP